VWHSGQRATLVTGWAITECSGRILDQALAFRLARRVATHARLILPNGSTSQEVHLADTSAWITLAAALGGVALTGTLSLATAALTHRWTEQARLQADRENEARTIRDQRREAYHNYLVATNSFYQAVDQVYLKTGRKEQFDQCRMHTYTSLLVLDLTLGKPHASTTSPFTTFKGQRGVPTTIHGLI